MSRTPETDAAKFPMVTAGTLYVPAEICAAIERDRTDLRAEMKVIKMALESTRSQLAKCRIQRERFHAQLRRGSTLPPDHA